MRAGLHAAIKRSKVTGYPPSFFSSLLMIAKAERAPQLSFV
jgi:hypothetical protein